MPKASTYFFHTKRLLITAGPTWEMIDPVRFLSNRSSGQMGFEIAKAAAKLGAQVTLVTGPTAIKYPGPNCTPVQLGPGYLTVVPVVSAREMHRECLKHFSKCDIAIMTAAVSDYRPAKVARHKIKKCLDAGPRSGMTLKLIRNPDILATLGRRKRPGQTLVGFALESQHLLRHAQGKLHRKNCDMIVANAVPTLGSPAIEATLLYNDGRVQKLPRLSKPRLAAKLMKAIT